MSKLQAQGPHTLFTFFFLFVLKLARFDVDVLRAKCALWIPAKFFAAIFLAVVHFCCPTWRKPLHIYIKSRSFKNKNLNIIDKLVFSLQFSSSFT